MKKRITLGLIAFQLIAFNAIATIEINFDTDAYGNPITAPLGFINTVRLSELYAPLGVHFWGLMVITGTTAELLLTRTVTLELTREVEETF